MNFKKVKTSLDINSKEAPSLYTALCLMETLIMDYQEETGKDFADIDIGDETLPLKMTLIYRTLKKVYNSKKDEFSRGVSRLDGMVQEAAQIEAELAALGGDCEKVSEFTSDLEAKKQAYEDALQSKAKCEQLQKEINAIDEKLADLSQYDPTELSALLKAKNDEFDKIGSEVTTLVDKLKDSEDQLNQMKQFKQERMAEFARVKDEIAALNEENEAISKEIDVFPIKKQKLRDDVANKKIHLQNLQEELDEYSQRNNMPLEEQVKLAEEKIKKASAEAETKSGEIKQLEDRYTQLTMSINTKNKEIDNFTSMCDELNVTFNEKSAEFEEIQQKWNETSVKYNNMMDNLESTRNDINEYENEKIPNTELILKDKNRIKNELVIKLEALNKEVEGLTSEVEELNVQLQPSIAEVERLTDLRSNLTADYGRKNEQIQQLKDELEELTGRTDTEKLNNYENQLRKNIEIQKNMENRCNELEEEINSVKDIIESNIVRQKELETQRDKLEKSKEDLDAMVKTLSVFDDPAIRKETDRTVKKLILLKNTSDKLLKHMQAISKYTNVNVDSIDNVEMVKLNIENLHTYVNSISEALDNYSKNANLEVRE